MGSLLLSPGSWCTQGFVCALQEFASPVLFKFWQLSGGVSGRLLQEGLCHTQVCSTQSTDSTADPYLRRRHPNTQRQVWLSLCGVSWCSQAFVWALRATLSGMGFDSKWLHPCYHLPGASPLPLEVGYLFLVGSNMLLSMVVQQWVVILKFSEKKMRAHTSTPPSCVRSSQQERSTSRLYIVTLLI